MSLWRSMAMFPSQGSVSRATPPSLNARRSRHGHRALRRRRWLRTPPALSVVGHTGQSEEHVRAPRIFGVGACARPTMGRCLVSCSGGFATSWRSRPFVGRLGTGRGGSSQSRYKGARVMTHERPSSGGLVASESGL